jgi:hypothetical protein
MTFTTSRRAMLGAAAAFAAAPAAALASASPATPAGLDAAAPAATGAVRALWDQVIDLSIRMNAHVHEIATADRGTGLPGWMYVQGEANALGNARYEALIEILKSTPASAEDIAIIARAATHHDILDGPKSFAHQQLAMAAMTLQAA